MGTGSGGTCAVSLRSEILWGTSPGNHELGRRILTTPIFLNIIFNIFEMKAPKSEEKLEFGGWWA